MAPCVTIMYQNKKHEMIKKFYTSLPKYINQYLHPLYPSETWLEAVKDLYCLHSVLKKQNGSEFSHGKAVILCQF